MVCRDKRISDSMVKLVISCMDRRLNEKFDGENDGDILFVRNAGGNVKGIERTLRYIADNNAIQEVRVTEHADCGGMKYVHGVLKGHSGEESINKALVDSFASEEFSDLAALEKKNLVLQKAAAEKLLLKKAESVSSEFVDAAKLKSEEGERKHILVVTQPSRKKYASIVESLKSGDNLLNGIASSDCYFIQADPSEITDDVALAAKKLHLTEVRVVALEPSERRQMQMTASSINMRFTADHVHAVYRDCTEVK